MQVGVCVVLSVWQNWFHIRLQVVEKWCTGWIKWSLPKFDFHSFCWPKNWNEVIWSSWPSVSLNCWNLTTSAPIQYNTFKAAKLWLHLNDIEPGISNPFTHASCIVLATVWTIYLFILLDTADVYVIQVYVSPPISIIADLNHSPSVWCTCRIKTELTLHPPQKGGWRVMWVECR